MIRIPLGTEVGRGVGDIVLDGDPATQRGTAAPTFRPNALARISQARILRITHIVD